MLRKVKTTDEKVLLHAFETSSSANRRLIFIHKLKGVKHCLIDALGQSRGDFFIFLISSDRAGQATPCYVGGRPWSHSNRGHGTRLAALVARRCPIRRFAKKESQEMRSTCNSS